MAEIRVTSGTTAQQLGTFLSTVDKNANLKAKDLGGGVTLLYTRGDKQSGMSKFDKLFRGASDKNKLARATIKDVLENARDATLQKTRGGEKKARIEKVFDDMRALAGTKRTSFMRVGAARLLMRGAIGEQTAAVRESAKKPPFPMAKLGDLSGVHAQVKTLLQAGKKDEAIQLLADAVADGVKKNFSQAERDDFAFSPGLEFRSQLGRELRQAFGKGAGKLLPLEERREFARKVFEAAAERVPADKFVDANTISLTKTVGGQQVSVNYTKGPQIGTGGFAQVFLYTNANDPTDTIAVKISKKPVDSDQGERILSELGREVKFHRQLASQGSDAIIGFEGAFRTPDGRIGIAMETAPLGNVNDVEQKLLGAVKSGDISPQAMFAVALTIIKRGAEGLEVQESLKIINGDVKSPNMLLTADGDIRLADFGTVQQTDSFVPVNSSEVANPLWSSPEFIKAKREDKEITSHADKRLAETSELTGKMLDETFGLRADGKRMAATKTLLAGIFKPETDKLQQENKAGSKVDSWSLGIVLHDLVYGRQIDDDPFFSGSEKKIEAFGRDPNNVAVGPGGYFESTSCGDPQVDDLINKLLHPDPDQRLSPSDALEHPAMSRIGIGGPDSKALLKALQTGDKAGLKDASDKLTPKPTVTPTQGPSPTAPSSPTPVPSLDLPTEPSGGLPSLPPTPRGDADA